MKLIILHRSWIIVENKLAITLLEVLQKEIDDVASAVELDDDIKSIESYIVKARDKRLISSKFNIPCAEIYLVSNQWYQVYASPEDIYLGFFDGVQRSIGCSDNRKQPDNEWLCKVGFCTGAYIFGQEYPTETFNAFFEELKTFNPNYIDTPNHSLYFDAENAGEVYRNLRIIYNKYKAEVQKELDKKKVAKLRAELEKLENNQ